MVIQIDAVCIFLVLLTPITVQYAFPFMPAVVLSDWSFLFAFILVGIKCMRRKLAYAKYSSLVFPAYVVIRQLVAVGFSNNTVDMDSFKSAIHMIVWYMVSFFLIPNIREVRKYEKYLHYIAIFSTSYLLLQVIVHFLTGYYISGTIPFLIHDEVLDLFAQSMQHSSSILRPRSIFLEPSHYGTYLAISLALIIGHFDDEKKSKYIKCAIFYSVGMFLSLSSTAIFLCLAIWGLHFSKVLFLKSKRISKRKLAYGLTIAIGLIALVVVMFKSSLSEYVIQRTFGTAGNRQYSALDNRTRDWQKYMFSSNSVVQDIIIGEGVIPVNSGEYIPQLISMPLYWGICGVGCYFFSVIPLFLPLNSTKKKIALVCLLLCLIGGTFASSNAPVLMLALAFTTATRPVKDMLCPEDTNTIKNQMDNIKGENYDV